MAFTRPERDLISAMIAIAEAGIPGEGDYQDWTEVEYQLLNSIARKLFPPNKKG